MSKHVGIAPEYRKYGRDEPFMDAYWFKVDDTKAQCEPGGNPEDCPSCNPSAYKGRHANREHELASKTA